VQVDRPAVIDRYWEAVRERDLEAVRACVTDDFVEDWPQSGERIRGIDDWHRMATAHPTYPSVTPVRTVGEGDLWVTEALFRLRRRGSLEGMRDPRALRGADRQGHRVLRCSIRGPRVARRDDRADPGSHLRPGPGRLPLRA
jgi:ketosteroid isomerase-like protein